MVSPSFSVLKVCAALRDGSIWTEAGYGATSFGSFYHTTKRRLSLEEAASSESISLEQGQNNGKHSPPEAGNAESKAMARRQIRKVDAEQTS